MFPSLWRAAHDVLADVQPQVVVGFGGWLTVPLLCAARQRSIPTVIHEQNIVPGRANRLLGWVVTAVAASFCGTSQTWLRVAQKLTVTGNPIRFVDDTLTRDAARQHWGADGAQLIVAMGGSGGSRAINEALPSACHALPAHLRSHVHVVHLAGANESPVVQARYAAAGVRAHVVPFLDHMALAYRAADVMVCRAGASTIAELAHFGCPAVLIPYPYARQHQLANAQLVARIGGAVVVQQTRDLSARLTTALQEMLDRPHTLHTMRSRMQELDVLGAADRLAQMLVDQCPADVSGTRHGSILRPQAVAV